MRCFEISKQKRWHGVICTKFERPSQWIILDFGSTWSTLPFDHVVSRTLMNRSEFNRGSLNRSLHLWVWWFVPSGNVRSSHQQRKYETYLKKKKRKIK
jgi:hypothetical protein